MQFLKVTQIYFKPEQLALCDYTPMLNEDCTVYFENSVIASEVSEGMHRDCEYFGVVSWNLRKKITSTLGPRTNIRAFDSRSFEEKLLKTKPDIMGFSQYAPHDPVNHFNCIHAGLEKHFKEVCKWLGLAWAPEIWNHVFYSNHFVAKSEIYERYVNEFLNPAIKVMDGMPELMGNSGYPRPLPIELRVKFGVSHYTWHTFILERLFSYFVHLNKFNVKYY